jgi:chromosome partition protein MukF
MATDPHRVIAGLLNEGASLQLGTVDLCFLIALHTRADEGSLTGYEEEDMLDVFEQVCEVVEPGIENPRKRATHAIHRLRVQRLLTRVDAGGVLHEGEYAMTGLASAIVQFYLHEEALTRESLTLLTKTLLANIADVKASARSASSDEDWRANVVAPLRITVGDLVGGIERRQRGLDTQQQEVQHKISELLQADWFESLQRCQTLLDDTTATLSELNEVLLHDTTQMIDLLQDVEQLAIAAGRAEAEEATHRVIEHVDRVAAWGRSRQVAWSEYYQQAHRFLRDVVRLDPTRALSERLRNQIAQWSRRRFALVVSAAGPLRIMRSLEARPERPAVVQPARDRELALEEIDFDVEPAEIEERVRAARAAGATTLAEVLRSVLSDMSPARQFVMVGRVAQQVAPDATSERERAWREVPGGIEVEDWGLKHE